MTATISKIKDNIKEILTLLPDYESKLVEARELCELKYKNLELLIKEHSGHYVYYDSKKSELSVMLKYIEAKLENKKGAIWKRLTERNDLDLSQKDKEQYVNADTSYLEMYEIYLQVYEVYKQYESLLKAFDTKGYCLKNIVDIRIHALHDTVI